jgi:hypothetical protein
MMSLAVAMSIACSRCSARCSGVIDFVVSRNCANGLSAKWNTFALVDRRSSSDRSVLTVELKFLEIIGNGMDDGDRATRIANSLLEKVDRMGIVRWRQCGHFHLSSTFFFVLK